MSYFAAIKLIHLICVTCSVLLFIVRGGAVIAGQDWPMRKPWRVFSYVIDTGLLAAGLTLAILLGLDPLTSHWLGAKLVLIVLYILLGSYALKRARTRRGQQLAFGGAIAVLLVIISVALNHHPLGVFAAVLS